MVTHLTLAIPWLTLLLSSTTVTAKPIHHRADSNTYDYIVVGSGPGGITTADKLSESGASVLLIERGGATTSQWGGNERPSWLDNSGLSFYDVPGLDNQIWTRGGDFTNGKFCPDIVGGIAGCVLGGGTAVNAGLWWKPASADWDHQFPDGWKSQDMQAPTDRVFERIPGTQVPSSDGKLYLQQGAQVLENALAAADWERVDATNEPDAKNKTYTNTTFMYMDGQRGGPLATYLVSANARPNFSLWTNTLVDKVLRDGATVTGVQVSGNDHNGQVMLSGKGGVVLSAGAFGTPKILFRSGIGPRDQLEIVQSSSDGANMVSQDQWIDLPVGYNLVDNINTDMVVSHPDVEYYNFAAAWDNPVAADVQAYLNGRTGMLTQSSSNLNPMFWETFYAEDGDFRQLQWTARVDTSLNVDNSNGKNLVISNYLTLGQVARGRATITNDLNMNVADGPTIDKNNADLVSVVKGIEDMRAVLENVQGLQILSPPSYMSALDYVTSTSHSAVNHWLGTCKMGTDDGRNGGSAVVDVNTKVYGTDNLFVVDGSIFPGQTSSNPSAAIVIVAEKAVEKILALIQ